MTAEFKKILNKIEREEMPLPINLVNKIILSVDKKVSHDSKIKALGLSFVSFISFLISIPIISQIITSFTQSGFYNYISIIFSDSDVAFIYWKEILISLIESLPVIGIASLLAIVVVFIWSTIKATSEVKNALVVTA